MLRWFQPAVLMLIAAGWSTAALAAGTAAPARLQVRAAVEVNTGVVRVADLVPAAAADQADYVLAAAPQPGAPLVWPRAAVLERLRDAGFAAARLAVPAEVVVTRRAAPIRRAAVAAALAAYLGHSVAAAAVQFTPPLTTVAGDPGIVVESARLDAARGWLVARCRARRDPALLPFTVFVQPASGDAQAALAAARRQALAAFQPPPPLLVQPGHAARLTIQRNGFSMVTAVMPLQAGAAGARIHATSPVTHAVLTVRVIGKNEVRLDDRP